MGFLTRHRDREDGSPTSSVTAAEPQPRSSAPALESGKGDNAPHPLITWRVFAMGVLVSMGGLIFGESSFANW